MLIWSVVISKSQAREVAMKCILIVVGVNPLVRIFRKAFGVGGVLLTSVFKAEKREKPCVCHLQSPLMKQPVGPDFRANGPYYEEDFLNCLNSFLSSILFIFSNQQL